MRSIIVTTVAASFLGLAGAASAQTPATVCKGVGEEACKAAGACVWREAVTAGQSLTKAGTPYKNSIKAHCRKGSKPKAS